MNYYTIELPIKEVEKFDIQNKVQIKYKNLPLGRIIYSAWDLTKGKNKFSKVLTKDNKSFFIRQTKNNTMYLTVRKNNKSDFKFYNVKLKLGYILSKIMFKKNIILLFEKGELLVTDYSSVAFDFSYLKKPIIYTHFDKEEFSSNHVYTKGYFGYEENGFGKVTYDYENTVKEIIKNIKDDCKMDSRYQKRVNSFFEYSDKNNCKRVYDEIKK